MAKLGDTLTSREAVRLAVLDDIVGRCQIAAVAIEGGALDGIEVVSMGTLRDQVTAALLIDLPPTSDRYAEVTTPANVTVEALCPECREPTEILVRLYPSLTVEEGVTKLAVKASSKAVNHMHGQQPLNLEGQQDFGLADLVGPAPTVEQLETLLLLVLPDDLCKAVPSTVAIGGWSDLEKREVAAWAGAVHLVASDNDDVEIPTRPEVVGGPPRKDEADGGTPAEPDPDAPSDPTLPGEYDQSSADDAAIEAAREPGGVLECIGSNHVPGCEHMGGETPPKRRARGDA